MESKKIIEISKELDSNDYEFFLAEKKINIFYEREFKEFLIKWNLYENLKILSFNFSGDIEEESFDILITNFLQSEVVSKFIKIPPCLTEETVKDKKYRIVVEVVPCTILSTDFFDRIFEAGIVLPDGTIRKCLEEYMDDIPVADELRNMLLIEDSDNYSLYEENERKEFLFRIFKHFCIGGILNQYEDNINQYILLSKILYKDVVCVRKCGAQKKITIKSKVFKVTCYDDNTPVFPSTKLHEQDFIYLIINPNIKEIAVIYHQW